MIAPVYCPERVSRPQNGGGGGRGRSDKAWRIPSRGDGIQSMRRTRGLEFA